MKIKAEYEKLDDIPEAVRALYAEQNGKHVLVGVEGVKPVSEFERVYGAHNREKEEHKATKEKLKAWGELDPTEVLAKLDRIKEFETAAGGKLDDKALDTIVETRIGSRLGPVERAKAKAESELAAALQLVGQLQSERKATIIRDAVTKAALAEKVLDTAIEDVVLIAERQFEVGDDGKVALKDAGLSVKDWLADQKEKRPHWWPASQGGGAGGSGVTDTGPNNPFSHEGWNLTKQGEIVRTKGEAYAQQLAERAGTTLGGQRPPKK